MRQSALGQERDRIVIVDFSIAHNTAVAVIGICAQTTVSKNDCLRNARLDAPDRSLDNPLFLVSARSAVVLMIRNSKQQEMLKTLFE